MIYSGKIQDSSGAPIKGASLLFLTDTGQAVVRMAANAAGMYSFNSDFDGGLLVNGMKIRFEAPDYGWYGVDAAALPQSFTVTLVKKTNVIAPWMIAAVLAALLIYSQQKGRGKKVGKLGPDDVRMVFTLAGGVIGLVILKQILEMLGFWDSKKEKELDAEAASPASPWNPAFWQQNNPYAAHPMAETTAQAVAKTIYKEVGIFWDNEDKVIAAIHSLKTKAEVSYVAWTFLNEYNRDLLTYIRNGPGSMPWHGLSAADVTGLNDYVKRLPNF